MKKIAFMFAAAALFAACGGAAEKPATEEENNVENQEANAPEDDVKECCVADSIWNKAIAAGLDTVGMTEEAKAEAFETAKKTYCEENCKGEGEETAEETTEEAPEA